MYLVLPATFEMDILLVDFLLHSPPTHQANSHSFARTRIKLNEVGHDIEDYQECEERPNPGGEVGSFSLHVD